MDRRGDFDVATVPVYEWLLEDGREYGLGTQREFDHWKEQGVVPPGATLGAVLTHEPASEDARRELAWAA
jgi:hypothetical protein